MQNFNKTFKILSKILLLFTLSIYISNSTRLFASSTGIYSSYKSDLMLSDYLKDVKNKMQNKTGVYVLEQGIEAMLSRAWLTQHAQTTIDVQYFIFSTDNIGLIATNYLIEAAKRGVKVRVLVDDIMVEASGEDLLKIASHKNIEIKIYNPMANIGKNIFQKIINLSTDFHKLNQRMHNKTFTIDGKVTITGGRNVADEYFGYDHEYNFRDRDVLLVGGVVSKVQKSFNEFWENKLSVDIKDLLKNKKLDSDTPIFTKLHEYASNPKNFVPSVRNKINEIPLAIKEIQEQKKLQWIENVQYISDIPGKNNANKFLAGGGASTDKLISLLKNSKESVIIQTPYLITTKKTRKILKELVAKGVDIKILTNSLASTDNLEAFNGYQRDRQALLKTGIEVYEFKPNAKIRQKIMSEVMQKQLKKAPIFGLHAKSMVVDNKTSIIGTYNVDPRSANLNTENFVIIPSSKIAKEIKEGMIEEMKEENAWKISLDWNPDSLVDLKKRIRVKIRRIVPKSIL
ncbi:phospholipase D family protein [Arcobacter sp. LA11]|uniref:phospholipase D family protein n=1 Tax=Arcobacter sp. LA11 TaxID=1898176 RepID=UPI002159F849|nr:phospholipase D family protein [Arcobacter sp. LA11]